MDEQIDLNKILGFFQEVSQEKKLVLPIQGFVNV